MSLLQEHPGQDGQKYSHKFNNIITNKKTKQKQPRLINFSINKE